MNRGIVVLAVGGRAATCEPESPFPPRRIPAQELG
jgi:hypothetical protein